MENFYTTVISDLSRKKQGIADLNTTLLPTNISNSTGLSDNLLLIKTKIQQYNNALHNIETLPIAQLSGYTTGQLHTLALSRAQENITPQSKSIISGFSNTSIQGLETLADYLMGFNLDTSEVACEDIVQTQAMKNDKVDILTSRKTNINANLDYIQANANTLKNNFTQAKNIYLTTPKLEDKGTVLLAKRNAINALQSGNGVAYGCTNKYEELCDTIESIRQTLNSDKSIINQHIENISGYNETQEGETSINTPLQDVQDSLDEQARTNETTQLRQTIASFATSNDTEKKDTIKGINITTSDRPIDSIRNITFQGIGGTKVQLNYPNLYEVPVYTQSGDKLILQTPEEIRQSIKTYMTQRIQSYNTLLQEQNSKKTTFYQTFSAQFNFLQTLDPLATPNRSYTLLPQNLFINKLIETLDSMTVKYGKSYIYGTQANATVDDKLLLIAKLLHYQNSPRAEKGIKTSVQADIQENKDMFNVNQKI